MIRLESQEEAGSKVKALCRLENMDYNIISTYLVIDLHPLNVILDYHEWLHQ